MSKRHNFARQSKRRARKRFVYVAQRLEGLSRHASTHAAGVVISPRPLTDIVPLYKTNRDEIITQYDMKALDRLGLLKMDFLGLTTLTVIDDAVKLIAQNRGQKIDLSASAVGRRDHLQTFRARRHHRYFSV